MGLPSLVLGPHRRQVTPERGSAAAARNALALDKQVVFGANPGASGFAANCMTTSGSTNFNVTPSETQDFYQGLLEPVEPQTLALFKEQGIADEILFYLFTAEGRRRTARRGPPNPIRQRSARSEVRRLSSLRRAGDALRTVRRTDARRQAGQVGQGGQGGQVGQDRAATIRRATPGTDWRLCFDRKAWAPDTPYADNHPLCGSNEKMEDPRTVTFRDPRGKLVTAHVFPRSTFSIFQYLGRLVAAGDEGQIKLITDQAIGHAPLEDDTLFAVTAGALPSAAIASSRSTMAGRTTACPTSALNTKRILGLLVQLLALNTSIRDVGITQQVQLLPQ